MLWDPEGAVSPLQLWVHPGSFTGWWASTLFASLLCCPAMCCHPNAQHCIWRTTMSWRAVKKPDFPDMFSLVGVTKCTFLSKFFSLTNCFKSLESLGWPCRKFFLVVTSSGGYLAHLCKPCCLWGFWPPQWSSFPYLRPEAPNSQVPRWGWIVICRLDPNEEGLFLDPADAECLDLLWRNGKFSVPVAKCWWESWKGPSQADIIYLALGGIRLGDTLWSAINWHSSPLLAHKNATKTKIQKHWVYAPQVCPVGIFFALCLSCILVLGPRCIFLLLYWHQLFVDLVYLPVTDMTVFYGICTWVLGTCSSGMQKGPDWYSFYLSFNKQEVPVLLRGHSTRTLWFARSSLVFRGSWVFRKVSYKNLAQYSVLEAINAGKRPRREEWLLPVRGFITALHGTL